MASDDIQIVIGAKDQATEILKKVERSTRSLTTSVDRMADVSQESSAKFDKAFKVIAVAVTGVTAAVGAFKGAAAAIAGMSDAVEAFNTQEEAARGMTQAQLDFAAAMQTATNVGDEQSLALMRQAEAMGATKEESAQLVESAVGISQAFGVSADEALKKVMQSVNGNANAMAELIPAISNAGTEAEKLAMINEAAARGLGELQDNADTTAGAMARSAGAFGDLQEKIGALLAPLYEVVYTGFAVFAETLQTSLAPAIDMVNGGFSGLAPVVEAFKEIMRSSAVVVGAVVQSIVAVVQSMVATFFAGFGSVGDASASLSDMIRGVAEGIIRFVTKAEVVFSNLPKVAELMATGVALRMETMRADIQHILTVAVPAYAEWFADNFVNLGKDAFNAYITIAQNWATNIGDIVTRVWDFISSGFEGGLGSLAGDIGDIAGRNLLEGFEAQTEALPEVGERAATALEGLLSNRMGQIGSDLAAEYHDKVQERLEGLNAEGSADFDLEMPNLEDLAKVGGSVGDDIADKITSSVDSAIQPINAVQSRLLGRAEQETPMQREMLKKAEMQAEASRKQTEYLQRIAEVLQEQGLEPQQLSLALVQ